MRMRPESGGAVIVVDRLPGRPGALAERQDPAVQSANGAVSATWEDLRKPSRYRAEVGFEASFRREGDDGRVMRGKVVLLRPLDGDGDFVLRAEAPEEEWTEALEATVDLTFHSLRFRKGRKG